MSSIASARPFAGVYTADPVHSTFQLAVRHMGVGSFRTGFDEFDARLEPTADGHRLVGTVAASSIGIRTPKEFRAHVVDGEDFLDAGRHPWITFASEDLDLGKDGTVSLSGTLTLRGITRPVVAAGVYRAPVEDAYGGMRAALDLTATIDRRDWGITYQATLPRGGNVLGWDVELSVHAELVAEAE